MRAQHSQLFSICDVSTNYVPVFLRRLTIDELDIIFQRRQARETRIQHALLCNGNITFVELTQQTFLLAIICHLSPLKL